MDAPCRIELFGGLRVHVGDRVITRFRTQKTASLLAYLAYHLPQAHPREVLIELLWPEVETDAGRNHLRMALTFLRRPLEPPGVPAGAVLAADRTSVRLNPLTVTTDVDAFAIAVKSAATSASDAERAVHLIRAVELYGGGLLPGSYEDWVQTEQQRLAEQFFQAVHHLIACCVKADDPNGALDYALRALIADPLREASHVDVMRLYAAGNRPAEGLRQYQELDRLLREELDTRPSPEARELAEKLTLEVGKGTVARRRDRPPPPSRLNVAARPRPTPDTQRSTLRLPLRFTRFFGREAEIDRLVQMLRPDPRRLTPDTRLITLTGSGGSGKTRLAIEVAARLAERFPGGIWFVPLADLADPRLVAGTIVDALRLPRSADRDPLVQAADFLNAQNAPAMLVLDNLEHLLAEERRKSEDGAVVVRALLERAPILILLVTSRQRLGLEGERAFPVEPLPVPASRPYGNGVGEGSLRARGTVTAESWIAPQEVMEFAGVQLFVDRAQAIKPDFQVTKRNADAVAALCHRLDGLPLAIELAAARANLFTPGQMVAQLEHRFDFLVGRLRDASDRHRTLRAAIDWSFRLLSPAIQRFFARLSVFRGGWTVAAAEAICGEPMALSYTGILRDCSLIVAVEADMVRRFRMLETLREYAESQLTYDEAVALARAHRDYFLALAEEADPQLEGPQQDLWFARLEEEHDNMRAALTSCRADEDGADAGLRIAVGLFNFWIRRGYVVEGCAWLEAVLARSKTGPSLPRRRALNCAGHMLYRQGENLRSTALFEQSLALCAEAGDKRGMAHALLHLGSIVYRAHGDAERSRAQFDACLSLYGEVGDKPGIASTQWNLAILANRQGDHARASVMGEGCLSLFRELGDSGGEALALNTLGDTAFFQGHEERAQLLYEESLALSSESGNKMCRAPALVSMGFVALRQKDYTRANRLFQEAETLFRAQSDTWCLASSLAGLGLVALAHGENACAKARFRESLGIMRQLENTGEIAHCLDHFVQLARARDHGKRLARLLGALETLQPAMRVAHVDKARSEMDAETFDAAWAEGRLMTLEQVVEYALEEDET